MPSNRDVCFSKPNGRQGDAVFANFLSRRCVWSIILSQHNRSITSWRMFTLQIPDASVHGSTSSQPDAFFTAFVLAPVLSFLVLAAYLAGSSIYAVTFHPLAGIPGPKLCAISRLPYWVAYYRGVDVSWMNRLHQRYGPVVRFGPTDLSYTAADAWQDIHGLVKGQPENPKAPEFSVQPVNGKLRFQPRRKPLRSQLILMASRRSKYAYGYLGEPFSSPQSLFACVL